MMFDARAAKLLAPGEHLTIPGCLGLRLVASAQFRTWTYRYKVAGLMKQVRLGHWPAMPVQAAVAAWQGLREGKLSGADPQAERKAKLEAAKPSTAYTVRELVTDYIDGHLTESRSELSAEAARRALHKLLDEDEGLASMEAASVGRSKAFTVIDQRKVYPTAAAKLRSLMASAWEYAQDSGKLPDDSANHWRDVMRGRLRTKGKIVGGEHQGPARRVLRIDEVRTLLEWLPNMHQTAQDMTILYLWTCTRGSEIVSMRPEHITEESTGWWWTIPASLTKNAGNPLAVDLRVPLFGMALEVVKRRLKEGMFDGYSQHFFSTYIYDLQPYSSKSKARPERLTLPVTNWTPHNLRRTARTLLAGLGCPNEVGEAIVGHMPGAMVATYNCWTYDSERVLWLSRLDQLLSAQQPDSPDPAGR